MLMSPYIYIYLNTHIHVCYISRCVYIYVCYATICMCIYIYVGVCSITLAHIIYRESSFATHYIYIFMLSDIDTLYYYSKCMYVCIYIYMHIHVFAYLPPIIIDIC
jgi:hypothetical protein